MATNIFNMTDTWNNGLTVFNAIKMNVTNTASAAGSRIMDLLTAGVSQFYVDPANGIVVGEALNGAMGPGTINTKGYYVNGSPLTSLPGMGGAIIADSPPPSQPQGRMWWESDTGTLYINYNDGTSIQWVGVAGAEIGGNVSNSGMPVSGQWAQWVDATHIQGVSAASTPFVQKAGDSMTGALTMTTSNPTLLLNKIASGESSVVGSYTAGVPRWYIYVSDPVGETGGNVGSNFKITRFSDAGAGIDDPLTINRATGNTTLVGDLLVAKATPVLILDKTASTQDAGIYGRFNGLARWFVDVGNQVPETGGNAGSNFSVLRYTDAGGFVDAPFAIRRSDGQLSIGKQTAGTFTDINSCSFFFKSDASGYGCIHQNYAAGTLFPFVWYNSASAQVGYIAATDTATVYATSSDARLKENDVPFTRGREVIDALPVKEFTWKVDGSKGLGLFAQDVEDVFPNAVSHTKDGFGIDYSKYVPLLIQALQEANARIDALEKQVGGVSTPRAL